jgi:imidazolonepropionase-like amidohydrolase
LTQRAIQPDRFDAKTIRLDGARRVEIRGATLLDGRGGATRSTVAIAGERIAAVAPRSVNGGADVDIVNAAGQFVIAGLIDAHLHLADGSRPRRDRDALAQRDQGVALLRTSVHYDRMLRAGVTTIRSLGGEPAEAAAAIRRAMLDQFLSGPRVLSAGTAVIMPLPGRGATRLVEAVKTVRRNFGLYADVVMLGSCQVGKRPPFTSRQLAELVDESHSRGVRAALRPLTQGEAIAGIRAGVDSIEGLPRDTTSALIAALAGRTTALLPLAASERDKKRLALIRLAYDQGVSIIAGSDWSLSAPERSLGRELAALSSLGLAPDDVIAAATWRSAAALGIADQVGEIAQGQLAELVVLRSDPRKDTSALGNPAEVVMVVQAGDQITA